MQPTEEQRFHKGLEFSSQFEEAGLRSRSHIEFSADGHESSWQDCWVTKQEGVSMLRTLQDAWTARRGAEMSTLRCAGCEGQERLENDPSSDCSTAGGLSCNMAIQMSANREQFPSIKANSTVLFSAAHCTKGMQKRCLRCCLYPYAIIIDFDLKNSESGKVKSLLFVRNPSCRFWPKN